MKALERMASMGLFDFLKRKQPTTQLEKNVPSSQSTELGETQFETRLRGASITNDAALIEEIVEKMVEEDPFQRFYQGMSDEDFGLGSKRTFQYTDVTTMNVDVSSTGDITIEGIRLGKIPEHEFAKIKNYHEKYMLTAYVYVTGGRYKEYDSEQDIVHEDSTPYNLDIFLQYN